jgi:hypothetical protein
MSDETLDSIVAQLSKLAKIRETKIESWATPSGDIVVLRACLKNTKLIGVKTSEVFKLCHLSKNHTISCGLYSGF